MTPHTAALLGLRLEHLMRIHGLSVARLAKESGLALNIVQRAAKGQGTRLSAWTVKALASTLDVSSDYLLGLPDRPESPRASSAAKPVHRGPA